MLCGTENYFVFKNFGIGAKYGSLLWIIIRKGKGILTGSFGGGAAAETQNQND